MAGLRDMPAWLPCLKIWIMRDRVCRPTPRPGTGCYATSASTPPKTQGSGNQPRDGARTGEAYLKSHLPDRQDAHRHSQAIKTKIMPATSLQDGREELQCQQPCNKTERHTHQPRQQ